jgi:hypothetical protein
MQSVESQSLFLKKTYSPGVEEVESESLVAVCFFLCLVWLILLPRRVCDMSPRNGLHVAMSRKIELTVHDHYREAPIPYTVLNICRLLYGRGIDRTLKLKWILGNGFKAHEFNRTCWRQNT